MTENVVNPTNFAHSHGYIVCVSVIIIQCLKTEVIALNSYICLLCCSSQNADYKLIIISTINAFNILYVWYECYAFVMVCKAMVP